MDITAEQQENLGQIAGRYQLDLIILFGSTASGKEHADSDLDIAVRHTGQTLPYREYADLSHDLHEIFPGREVDLSFINHADPLFLKKITENCRLLYGDPAKLRDLKLYAFKRYQDHRRFLDMERAFVERFLSEKRAA